jgi:hypothetical protein
MPWLRVRLSPDSPISIMTTYKHLLSIEHLNPEDVLAYSLKHDSKLTLKKIGELIGVSADRARCKINKVTRTVMIIENRAAGHIDDPRFIWHEMDVRPVLSVRAQNLIHNSGLNMEEIKAKIESGEIRKYRNCGSKTIREFEQLFGIRVAPPSPDKASYFRCPDCGLSLKITKK